MPIYLFNFLPCVPCIHFLCCYIRHSIFALANAGLITHGGIFTCLGVIFIRYAQSILVLRVRYVRYTLACNARSFSWFEFARNFEYHLARPPPFYMRMQTRRLPMNIPLLRNYICYTVHVLYSQPIRLIQIYIYIILYRKSVPLNTPESSLRSQLMFLRLSKYPPNAIFLHANISSRMQASGERRRVLHRRPRLCIVPIH